MVPSPISWLIDPQNPATSSHNTPPALKPNSPLKSFSTPLSEGLGLESRPPDPQRSLYHNNVDLGCDYG